MKFDKDRWDGVFNVGNVEQKIIFLAEMQGQLSDGYWENSKPYDHWHPWAYLNWDRVVVVPDDIGLTGRLKYAQKRNYRFNNKELLEIVGERIIFKINAHRFLGEKFEELLKIDHWLLPDDGKVPTHPGEFWDKRREQLARLGLTDEVMADIKKHGTYTMKDLRRDCTALSKAMKFNAINQ